MKIKIAVIGLGYVGLPLAHAFSSRYPVVGYDIASWRIEELRGGHDRTLELSDAQLKEAIANGSPVKLMDTILTFKKYLGKRCRRI